MIIFFIAGFFVLVVTVAILMNRVKTYAKALQILDANYQALDKGREEQEESFEQQCLSFEETVRSQQHTIQFQSEEIEELRVEVNHHREYCLPNLTSVRDIPLPEG